MVCPQKNPHVHLPNLSVSVSKIFISSLFSFVHLVLTNFFVFLKSLKRFIAVQRPNKTENDKNKAAN